MNQLIDIPWNRVTSRQATSISMARKGALYSVVINQTQAWMECSRATDLDLMLTTDKWFNKFKQPHNGVVVYHSFKICLRTIKSFLVWTRIMQLSEIVQKYCTMWMWNIGQAIKWGNIMVMLTLAAKYEETENKNICRNWKPRARNGRFPLLLKTWNTP